MSDEYIRSLQTQVKQLQREVASLRVQLDSSAKRPAVFGRQRQSVWGVLLDDLPAGGSADVSIRRRQADGSWETLWTMEDVLAPPIMPSGTCILKSAWVRVTWSPIDEEAFVTGAETCPGTCPSDSSSS